MNKNDKSGESKIFRPEALAELVRENERWQEEVYPAGKERLKEFTTLSGLPIEPLYTPGDVSEMDYLADLGFPGEEPFIRGVHPNMYRGRTWTQRQLAGFGPAEETNKRYKFLLEAGANGINGVFDYPTLRGYDSTDPQARADAGRGGVAIDTIEDMAALFDGIPIGETSISLVTCQPICNISIQSMYFALAQARGVPLDRLAGTSQNDFLMETAVTIAPGVSPPPASFKLSCDAIEFCARHARRWNPISFAGYNYREAGCTAIQEIAFVMANALACSEEMLRRGLGIDDFAPRLSFFLSGHNDFFEEVAKYRAARRLWARLVKKRFKPQNHRSLSLRFHVQTAGVALTAQQPLNNIVRSSYHALAAVLGGAQSVHVDGFDEALCTPTELSSLTALRTQQILQLETRVTHTVDPLGGSYFIEDLTNRIEKRISSTLDEIDALGGIVKAVEEGWVHREISDAAYAYQQAVESGEMPIVGVNCFRTGEEKYPVEIFQVPETLAIQEAKIKRIKAERDSQEAQKALDDIRRCCEADGNLMEVIIESVKARVSEGEISSALKDHYGVWTPPLF
ncbi:MAG: methylmalonyl-CoA mutase family protein [Thermodesulfobacteriota bacterium]|nr:methylmalonyl-CoA mutase family protein [Thermodesulfobacteriota bacterium]